MTKKNNKEKEPAPRKSDTFQSYGIILKVLGGYHYDIKTMDGDNFQGRLSGSLRRFTRVKTGDIILVSLREFDKEKCDIIYVYDDIDTKKLYKEGEITSYLGNNKIVNEDETNDDDDTSDNEEEIIFDEL